MDDFSGGFSELMASINLHNDAGTVSGFSNFAGRSGDDYSSTSIAGGVRINW